MNYKHIPTALVLALAASGACAQLTVGVSWSNFQEERWKTDEAAMKAQLEKLGAEKTELEAGLASGALSGPDIAECGRRLNHIAAETAMLEERWLELHGEIEALTSGNS